MRRAAERFVELGAAEQQLPAELVSLPVHQRKPLQPHQSLSVRKQTISNTVTRL
jgi:hypothetical protein